MKKVVVTGGAGVVGSVLVPALAAAGWAARILDSASAPGTEDHGDIRDPDAVAAASDNADGIIHLAAVSRVGWGEDDPQRCWSVNVDGTACVLRAASTARRRPWVLFVSSREVYGNPDRLPVGEDAPPAPVNTYGRSKAEGEKLVSAARAAGSTVATIRLPSVYGPANDIPDRVIPALTRKALRGENLRITGAGQLCDFLHASDAVAGILGAASKLAAGERCLPTVHLASGRGTSLGELARVIKKLTDSDSRIVEDPPRPFDVLGFVGNPARAKDVIGWAPTITLEDGLAGLVAAFRQPH